MADAQRLALMAATPTRKGFLIYSGFREWKFKQFSDAKDNKKLWDIKLLLKNDNEIRFLIECPQIKVNLGRFSEIYQRSGKM